VDNSEVPFRAALTGLFVMHVADVVEFTAPSAGPEEARLRNCGRPGFLQPLLSGRCQPSSIFLPRNLGCVRAIPRYNAHLELPAAYNFHALEKVV
jgi:hypothetical protein